MSAATREVVIKYYCPSVQMYRPQNLKAFVVNLKKFRVLSVLFTLFQVYDCLDQTIRRRMVE
jgi:hypothetical protein